MSAPEPYFSDGQVSLYVGDCREVLPALGLVADCVIADPPYESTSLGWDKWPDGWLETAAAVSRSMWCFLPRRQFVEPPFRGHEFWDAGWRFSQPAIWEKHAGSGFAADRLWQVHEEIGHWYRGPWSGIYHEVPRLPAVFSAKGRTVSTGGSLTPHTGRIGQVSYRDDGLRLARSVLRFPSVRRGISRTQKPVPLLDLLIRYACPPGGLVVSMFAGGGSDLEAARSAGRRAVGVEADEEQAGKAARRLSQAMLDFGGAA